MTTIQHEKLCHQRSRAWYASAMTFLVFLPHSSAKPATTPNHLALNGALSHN